MNQDVYDYMLSHHLSHDANMDSMCVDCVRIFAVKVGMPIWNVFVHPQSVEFRDYHASRLMTDIMRKE